MDYKDFFAHIKKNTLPGCVLMHGEEEYTKERALEQLRKSLLPEGLEVMNESVFEGNVSERNIADACELLPFMAEKRLVLVREYPLITSGKAGADEGILTKYIPQIPPTTLLVFYVRGNADTRKRLPKAVASAGGLAVFSRLDAHDLTAFIARECESRGAKISRGDAERLILRCGNDLSSLSGEIEKLCAYCANTGVITGEAIEAVVIPSLESNVFQFVDSIADRDVTAAARMWERLKRDGESPVMMLALMTRAIRQLHQAKILLSTGQNRAAAAKTLGLSGFIAERVFKRAAPLSKEWLAAAEGACVETDFAIKSGKMHDEPAFALLVQSFMEKR